MFVALAVGKARMGQDALDLVQLLGTIQGTGSLEPGQGCAIC